MEAAPSAKVRCSSKDRLPGHLGYVLPLTHDSPAVSSSTECLINEIIVSYNRLKLLNNISTKMSFKEKKKYCFLLTLNCSACATGNVSYSTSCQIHPEYFP